MALGRPAFAAALCLALALVACSGSASSSQGHFLDFSEDNFKVVFISGNLTVAFTRDWPRAVFEHSTDLLTPTFEIGFSALYLFNDTNGDGVFARSEAVYVSYLDAHHNVSWNQSGVEFRNDTVGGEVASFGMHATLSLYAGLQAIEPAIVGWANMTMNFTISEKDMVFENSFGRFVVKGRTEVRSQVRLDILVPVDQAAVALEQRLSGGGSTYMLLLKERSAGGTPETTWVSGRDDETVFGDNFTHRLRQTDLPCQTIEFAKPDGTVQAFYNYSSEPLVVRSSRSVPVPMNSSYYTTGSGMVLHTVYALTNETTTIEHESSMGILESGFGSEVRDWFEENLAVLFVVPGVLVATAAIVTMVLVRRMRRESRKAAPPNEGQPRP